MTTDEETRFSNQFAKSITSFVNLTATQYAAFIQDKWSWQQEWAHSNKSYTRGF